MSIVTGVTLKVLINEFDMSGYFRKMDLTAQRSMYDTTVFGSTAKQSIPGLRLGTIGVEGLFEDTSTIGNPDTIFRGLESSATVPLVSVFPEGWALGKRAYLLQAHENKHDIGAQIDALVLNSAEFTDNDGYDFGVSLHALSVETSLPVTGTSVNNGAATANGGVGFLHISAIEGESTNVVYRIQHATDNATWIDLIVFSAVTAESAQRTVVASGTTIRRYLRMTATEGDTTSSITGNVSFARR